MADKKIEIYVPQSKEKGDLSHNLVSIVGHADFLTGIRKALIYVHTPYIKDFVARGHIGDIMIGIAPPTVSILKQGRNYIEQLNPGHHIQDYDFSIFISQYVPDKFFHDLVGCISENGYIIKINSLRSS